MPFQPPPRPSSKLSDALHAIQEEYTRLLAERDGLRVDLARTQTLAIEQDAELDMIRRAIWSLQNKLENHRKRFEDERQSLFEELRQQRAAAGLRPPSPLRELSYPPPLSASTSSSSVIDRPELMYDRKHKGRVRDYSELETDDDLQREQKRFRSNDGHRVPSIPIPSSAPPTHHQYHHHHSHHQPLPSSSSSNTTSTPIRDSAVNGHGPNGPTMANTVIATSTTNPNAVHPAQPLPTPPPPLPPKKATPPLLDELTLANVPQGYRKELHDWAVNFNPKLPRNVDVDLVQSIPHPSVVCSIHFSPDGQYVATGCNQAVYIYDIKSGIQVCSLSDPSLPKHGDLYIRSVRFSPDGEYLATGAEDSQVRIWNIKQRTLRYVFAGHSNEIYALDYSRNGRYVVSGSADGTAIVWDVTKKPSPHYTQYDHHDHHQQYSHHYPHKGRHNHSHQNIHKILRVLDSSLPTSRAQSTEQETECGITSISISSSSTHVAGGCVDRFIRIWNIATGEMVAKLAGHEDSVYAVRFMPAIIPSKSGRDREKSEGDPEGSKREEGGKLELVSASLDRTVRRWDVSALNDPASSIVGGAGASRANASMISCPMISCLRGHQDYVLTVACSDDCQWIVSGAKDRALILWDSNAGMAKFKLNGHTNSVISVDMHGRYIATASGDMCCRIWSFPAISSPPPSKRSNSR